MNIACPVCKEIFNEYNLLIHLSEDHDIVCKDQDEFIKRMKAVGLGIDDLIVPEEINPEEDI
jgi:hypothetical protein